MALTLLLLVAAPFLTRPRLGSEGPTPSCAGGASLNPGGGFSLGRAGGSRGVCLPLKSPPLRSPGSLRQSVQSPTLPTLTPACPLVAPRDARRTARQGKGSTSGPGPQKGLLHPSPKARPCSHPHPPFPHGPTGPSHPASAALSPTRRGSQPSSARHLSGRFGFRLRCALLHSGGPLRQPAMPPPGQRHIRSAPKSVGVTHTGDQKEKQACPGFSVPNLASRFLPPTNSHWATSGWCNCGPIR